MHQKGNFGTILNPAIKFFLNKYLKNIKEMENEIDIKLKISKNDINKEIYFLDNIDIIDENGYLHSHDNLKELNELLLLLIFKQIMCYYIEKYKIFYFA